MTWPGILAGYNPKFVKKYADVQSILARAVRQYADEVRGGVFPDEGHTYHTKKKAKP